VFSLISGDPCAITGGLAGIYYCLSGIPETWLDVLMKKDEILVLCERFALQLS